MTPLAKMLTPYRMVVPELAHLQSLAENDASGWYVRDVPPEVAAGALSLVDERMSLERGNDMPPARWLVDTAARLRGRLVGFTAPERDGGVVFIDGIKVPRDRRHDLVQAVADAWPEDAEAEIPAALDLAVGEIYEAWNSLRLVWKGAGRDLMGRIPPGPVVGLWWD